MTSYQLSQEHNFQSILWAIGGAIHQTPTALTRWAVWLSALFALAAADLALLLSGLLTVLVWVLGIAAIVGALALLLANPVLLLAGLVIVGYGWATYPQSKAVQP